MQLKSANRTDITLQVLVGQI